MKAGICAALFFLGLSQCTLAQTDAGPNSFAGKKSAADSSTSHFAIVGATAQQEILLRSQMEIMQPRLLPLRVVFLPHWKYVETTRIFQLHVPTGSTSAMFTHLPSRTTFVDNGRYLGEDWLSYWMAHELGHLATNSPREDDAERVAHEYRKRIRDAQHGRRD